jgi:hypothetical protein
MVLLIQDTLAINAPMKDKAVLISISSNSPLIKINIKTVMNASKLAASIK